MKVIALNGSARKDGNTAILLNLVLDELKAEGIGTELVQMAGRAPQGCLACYKCFKNKDRRCAVTKTSSSPPCLTVSTACARAMPGTTAASPAPASVAATAYASLLLRSVIVVPVLSSWLPHTNSGAQRGRRSIVRRECTSWSPAGEMRGRPRTRRGPSWGPRPGMAALSCSWRPAPPSDGW